MIAWLGLGLSSAFISLVPFFPANPLLVTGDVFPDFGAWGIALLLISITAVEMLQSSKTRVTILVAVVALGQIPFALHSLDQGNQQATSEQRTSIAQNVVYSEIDISNHKAMIPVDILSDPCPFTACD